MFDKQLLEVLVCPNSKTKLIFDDSKQELISLASGLAYPVRDGIPVMLEEEARQITIEEKESYKKR